MPKLFVNLLLCILIISPKPDLPDSKLAKEVRTKVWPRLQKELTDKGLKPAAPLYLRIFKDSNDLEVWVKSGSKFQFFKTYTVCYFSGGLGTKTRTGDGKSPEGFYTVGSKQLNPVSNYYLALNIGYPNKLEVLKGYTGDAVMIHGNCVSIGCYAMTNTGIEDIYTLVYEALKAGQQKINVDIFPFRMDKARMQKYAGSPEMPFWKTMKPGYDIFEKTQVPAETSVKGKEYSFF